MDRTLFGLCNPRNHYYCLQVCKRPSGIQGVIAIDFNLLEMSNEISNSRVGEDGLVMLLSSNGTIIANRDNNMIGESLFRNQFTKMIQETSTRHVPYVIQE